MPRAPLDRWLFRRMALVCGLLMTAVSLISVAVIYAEEDIEEDLAQGDRLQSIAQALLTAMEADPDFRNRVRPSAPAQRVGKQDQGPSMSWRVWSSDGSCCWATASRPTRSPSRRSLTMASSASTSTTGPFG